MAKRSHGPSSDPQVLVPITAAERAILDRVAASPVIQVRPVLIEKSSTLAPGFFSCRREQLRLLSDKGLALGTRATSGQTAPHID